jgi:tetratricopeptide (TPR) repeat protein
MPKPRKNLGSEPPFNPAALRVMMERTLGGLGQNKRSDEARAQELVYDAMEASTWARRLRLVRQALELDPENVDALLMLEGASEFKGEERIEALRGIVAAGAKRLGKKAFKELVPHFWGFHETRPYMRARQELAAALHEAGRLDEAAQEWAEMLALNENDNQGVRYELLPTLLARARLDEAQALMERFKDEGEWSVVFAWSRVLERHLSGDDAAATKALAVARKQNPHMEAYLKGHRKLPKNLPGSYSPGSKEEALCYATVLMAAWKAHPVAVAWLSGQAISSRKSMDGMAPMDGMDKPGKN